MKIHRFEEIEGWKLGRQLTRRIYRILGQQRLRDRRFVDQVTAAAVSVMNNVAEGFDSQSNREFIRFLVYSRRSCSEIQSCLYVALDENYLTAIQFQELYDLARRTRCALDGLLTYLRGRHKEKSATSEPAKPAQPA
jgi:four helix bundle protein